MITPIIIAGGAGTRLWPLSRTHFPKQFLTLSGEQTMLQQTLTRLRWITTEPPIILCNQEHRIIYRPWGCFDSIEEGERFKVKRITVKPGEKLSLQIHHHRAEHCVIVTGTAKVTHNNKTEIIAENESIHIHVGEPHALENPGKIPLEMIEVQTGSYLGEDDIVRLDDRYGRDT